MANLLMALYDSGRTTFTTAEAAQITGLTAPLTSSLLHKARKRGLVFQLKLHDTQFRFVLLKSKDFFGNISLLSNRLAAGGGLRIREDVLERDYCLAWFLNAVAESDLRTVLDRPAPLQQTPK